MSCVALGFGMTPALLGRALGLDLHTLKKNELFYHVALYGGFTDSSKIYYVHTQK